MKQLALISGKGGTGKTSLGGAFVRLAGRSVAVDADVDAANLALLLPGDDRPWRPFEAGRRAIIDPRRCSACGACLDACRFEAISQQEPGFESDPIRCEGCGACAQVCGEEAVSFRPNQAGSWTTRVTRWGRLVHATLGLAQDSSGKLVAHLRGEARRLAPASPSDDSAVVVCMVVGDLVSPPSLSAKLVPAGGDRGFGRQRQARGSPRSTIQQHGHCALHGSSWAEHAEGAKCACSVLPRDVADST